MLIINGTTETDLTLDDVEYALFPPTEVMPAGIAPRLAQPRKGWEMTVSQKLQVARDLVAQGWAPGALVSRGMDGRFKYCARGALNKAFLGRATSDAEFRPDNELRLAQRLIAEAMLGRYLVESDSAAVRVVIRTWNDSQYGPGAQQRVVAVFDAAIAECERLKDDAEKALATQAESHQRHAPTLTTTSAPTSANHTHPPGRHRAHRLDRPYRPNRANYADGDTRHHGHRSGTSNPRPPTNVAQRGSWTANRSYQGTPRG
jgi:hypothetical protein